GGVHRVRAVGTNAQRRERRAERNHADLTVEAPGARETGSVPWPLLLQQRMSARVEESDRYRWIVLFTALFGLLTVTFTITILAVSIPTIAEDLGTSQSSLTWLITGPLLVFAVVGPAVGKLGDRRGHRPVYLIGLAGAALFAAATALAWNGPSLIAFRILGATMGAATGPASMAMINTIFPPERRAQAMGFWTMVMAGGPVAGVVIGGPVVEAFSWRWIFIVQVPLTLAGLFVAAAVLPNTQPQDDSRFDIAGTVLLGSAVLSALIALNRGPGTGWGDPTVVGGFVLAVVLLVGFVAVEQRASDPLLPLHYLSRRNFSLPLVMEFFLNFAYMGGFILTPLLLQNVLDYSETRTGLLSTPRSRSSTELAMDAASDGIEAPRPMPDRASAPSTTRSDVPTPTVDRATMETNSADAPTMVDTRSPTFTARNPAIGPLIANASGRGVESSPVRVSL
ncbi:MAG: MFS transporter, partial [Actinomycetota bacterium]